LEQYSLAKSEARLGIPTILRWTPAKSRIDPINGEGGWAIKFEYLITMSRGKVRLVGPELPNWLLSGWLIADTDFFFGGAGSWTLLVAPLDMRAIWRQIH
jgi:hypothetical protein